MTVKERLIDFIHYKNISNSEFCRSIEVSAAFVSSMVKSIQPDKIKRITLKYPELNMGWLLTGEGEMLKSEEKPIIPLINTETAPMSVLQFIMESSKTASAQMGELIRQNGVLVDTVQKQAEIINRSAKKPLTDAHPEENAKCANVSGSDLQE